MTCDADPLGIDVLAPDRIVQKRGDVEGNIERTLPKFVGEIDDGRIVSVGAIVVGRGDDIAARCQRLGEPGVLQRI
jgi:hypothetical protein